MVVYTGKWGDSDYVVSYKSTGVSVTYYAKKGAAEWMYAGTDSPSKGIG